MTLPLPDFTHFPYTLVNPPDRPKSMGWDKLKECERRLALYRWAERLNAPPKGTQHLPRPPHHVFLDDCLSAFLMPLEAALQFMGQSLEHLGVISRHGLNTWLRKRRAHDRYMRGLRTLRHFAAHVEIKPARAGVYVRAEKSVEVRPGWHRVTESTISHRWLLPQLTRADLAKLDTSELNFKALKAAKTSRAPKAPRALKDLRAWNKLVVIHDAGTILEHGLRQAQAILLAAERLL